MFKCIVSSFILDELKSLLSNCCVLIILVLAVMVKNLLVSQEYPDILSDFTKFDLLSFKKGVVAIFFSAVEVSSIHRSPLLNFMNI